MDKIKVVHFINNFFAGIGGEEKADIEPEIREGVVGPGVALQQFLGDEFEVVATAICGDSHFGAHLEEDTETLIEMISKYEPQLFVAGPAFNAGRYGVACGNIAKSVEERLQIPVVTGMYVENPGVDMFRKDLYIIATGDSAADMRNSMPKIVALGKKLVKGEEILGPAEEGYHERGIRVNYFNETRGSERGIQMLLKKMAKEPFETEYPMPDFDRVEPAAPLADLKNATIAVVTTGGIVPQGNPDRIESSSATKYGKYSIKGMDHLDKADFMTIHGGYDRAFVTEDPDLVVPLDVLRKMEKEGKFAKLYDDFFTTTGTGTATGNAKVFGEEIVKQLQADGVDAVILTST